MDLIQKAGEALGALRVGESPMTARGELGEERLGEETQCPFATGLPSTGVDWHSHCDCGSSHSQKVMQLVSGSAEI